MVDQMRHGSEEGPRPTEGATAVEYAIMVSLIAAVIIAVVRTIGQWLPGGFQQVIDALP